MSTTPKKRPGRPRKQQQKKQLPKHGIVDEPHNKGAGPQHIHTVELLHDDPTIWKKIFALLKGMRAEAAKMAFNAREVIITTKDHLGANLVHIRFHCERINRYYCAEPIEIGIDPRLIEKVMQCLDAEHTSITFVLTKMTERGNITMIFRGGELGDEDINDIDLIPVPELEDAQPYLDEEENYPLKFQVPFKKLKKKISYYSTLTPILTIQKNGTDDVTFSHVSKCGKVRHRSPFRKGETINLRSNIEPGDIFGVSFYINKVNPLTSSIISDTLHIAADKDKKLIFTAYLGEEVVNKRKREGTEVVTVKVLTDIITAT